MGVLDTLEGVTAATHSVTLCMDAAAKAEHDAASRELESAADKDVKFGSLAMEHTTAAVEKLEAARDRMIASQVTFEFSTDRLPWTKRLALQAKHPPRTGNLIDRARGYNVDTFLPELVKATCVAVTGVDGERVTKVPAKTWAKVFATFELGRMQELTGPALANSDQAPVIPPSARYLLMSQDSVASSTQPGPGTPRRNGSAAGSRRTSRKSPTAKKAAPRKAGSSG